MNNYYVYRHIRLDTKTPFYVGVGRGYRARNLANRGEYHKNIQKIAGCKIEYVFKNISKEESLRIEIILIKAYRKFGLCEANFKNGGGWKLSAETRKRIGQANIGKHPMTKEKLSILLASRKGKESWNKGKPGWSRGLKLGPLSEDVRRKIAKARTGTLASPETKEKMSKSQKGKRTKLVFDTCSGMIWNSVEEASKAYCVKYSTLTSILNGTNPNRTNLRYV